MAFEEKRCCLWHAFNALDEEKVGSVNKSKLKVLTQNIGTSVGVPNAHVNLDNYRNTKDIAFTDFLTYLKLELFNQLQPQNEKNANLDLSKVDEVCWMLCCKKFLSQQTLTYQDAYKLWRLFNFLAETDQSGEPLYPVVMHIEEVALSVERLLAIVGQVYDKDMFKEVSEEKEQFDFVEVLGVIESQVLNKLEPDIISAAIKEVYDDFVTGVLKKDILYKKAPRLNNWKERWFVLTSCSVKYFSSRDEHDLKGEVLITPNCSVQSLPDKSGMGQKQNRFNLISEGRTFELCAPDARSRTSWIAVLRTAIEQCNKPYTPQKVAVLKRRTARFEKLQKKKEEEEKRQKEWEQMELTKQELLAEKQARAKLQLEMIEEVAKRDAELQRLEEIEEERLALQKRLAEETTHRDEDKQKLEKLEKEQADLKQKLLEEATLLEAEKRRRKEMEEMQKELKRLLEEEKQAKRDEELVRAAQARMLDEELTKREELEAKQQEMEGLLEDERVKREGLEAERQRMEGLIAEERRRLDQLTLNRKSMDRRMQETLDKLDVTEKAKNDMYRKLHEKEREHPTIGKVEVPDVFTSPDAKPVTSHRGVGVFTESELALLARSWSVEPGLLGQNADVLEEKQGEKLAKEDDDNECDEGIEKGDESVDEVNDVVVPR